MAELFLRPTIIGTNRQNPTVQVIFQISGTSIIGHFLEEEISCVGSKEGSWVGKCVGRYVYGWVARKMYTSV
jgi:hypothetical protein